MKVAVGSLNPVKVEAVRKTFKENSIEIVAIETDSGVSKQPLSHDETRLGAVNRAKDSLTKAEADLGIGLEGGVTFIEGLVYLTNWGAIADREGHLFVVSGPTIQLPSMIEGLLKDGLELNEIMYNFLGIEKLGSQGGVMGLFTKGSVSREDVFHQMVEILWGQYQYYTEGASPFSDAFIKK